MTLTVSISEFRNNMSDYLDKVSTGARLLIKDEKKAKLVAEVVGKKEFDPEAFRKALDKAAGVFTAEKHPEWRTKRDVINWVRKQRIASDRKF